MQTTTTTTESVFAKYQRLFMEKEQARVALQDKKDQLAFLKGAMQMDTRNNYAKYSGDSEYLKAILGDSNDVSKKTALISAEIERVQQQELPECEKAVGVAHTRLHNVECRLAELRNAEWRIPVQTKQAVDPAVAEVLQLERECAELRATIEMIENRAGLFLSAARMFKGERTVWVDSPTVNKFTWGPSSPEEKSDQLTNEVNTKLQPEWTRAQERLAVASSRIAQLKVALARQIHPMLVQRQRELYRLLDQAEAISGELDELLVCRGVGLPLGRVSERHFWGGLNYFRNLGQGETSEYRSERMGRIEAGVLDAAELQRRAS